MKNLMALAILFVSIGAGAARVQGRQLTCSTPAYKEALTVDAGPDIMSGEAPYPVVINDPAVAAPFGFATPYTGHATGLSQYRGCDGEYVTPKGNYWFSTAIYGVPTGISIVPETLNGDDGVTVFFISVNSATWSTQADFSKSYHFKSGQCVRAPYQEYDPADYPELNH